MNNRIVTADERTPLYNTNITYLIRYLVLVPILAPRGLEVYIQGYKSIITFFALLSLGLVLFDSMIRFRACAKILPYPVGFLVYFVLAFLLTLFSPDGISAGLQALFYYPAAFFYIIGLDEQGYREYSVAAAHILLVLFLCQILLGPSLFSSIYHRAFLGHIQVFSQYGMLAAFLVAQLLLKKWGSKLLPIALLISGAICMITVEADSAHLALAVLVVGLLLLTVVPTLVHLNLRFVTVLGFCISALTVWLTITSRSPLINTGLDWTFNGRLFVWESANALISNSPWVGYGVENTVISTFWSEGMTYAHNQLMQCLVDGGVILLLAMIWMLLSVCRYIKQIDNLNLKRVCIAIYCSLLFISIFDSFTLYGYSFVLIAFMVREGLIQQKVEYNEY